MKKVLAMIIGLLVCFSSAVCAQDNFLLVRFESGRTESGDKFDGTYHLFEHSGDKWSLGSKLVTGNSGFMKVEPFALYDLGPFEIGARYGHDSSGNNMLGPGARIVKKWDDVLLVGTLTHFFDLSGKNDVLDAWVLVKKSFGKFYLGSEIWDYYNFGTKENNFRLRPIKFGWRWKNLSPFVMPEIRYINNEYHSISGLFGVELRF